jgi:hypothetical protein
MIKAKSGTLKALVKMAVGQTSSKVFLEEPLQLRDRMQLPGGAWLSGLSHVASPHAA